MHVVVNTTSNGTVSHERISSAGCATVSKKLVLVELSRFLPRSAADKLAENRPRVSVLAGASITE